MMWQKWIKLVAILVAIQLSSGCGKTEVSGEIFVVTKGRENVSLGNATIYFVNNDEVIDYFSKAIRESRNKNSIKAAELTKKMESRTKIMEDVKTSANLFTAKVDATKERLVMAAIGDPDYATMFDRAGGYSKHNIDYFVKEIVDNQNVLTAPIVEELRILSEDREKIVLKFHEEMAVKTELDKEYLEIQKVISFVDVINELDKMSKGSGDKLTIYSASTNSAGQYKVSLPNGVYRVFALQSRSLPLGGKEDYGWAFTVEIPKEPKVSLTPSNIGIDEFNAILNKRSGE